MTEMLPLFDGEDVPRTFPDGSHIPVGFTLLLATQEHITPGEARRRMIEAWWDEPGSRAQTDEARRCMFEAWKGEHGNRAQRRQRGKK